MTSAISHATKFLPTRGGKRRGGGRILPAFPAAAPHRPSGAIERREDFETFRRRVEAIVEQTKR